MINYYEFKRKKITIVSVLQHFSMRDDTSPTLEQMAQQSTQHTLKLKCQFYKTIRVLRFTVAKATYFWLVLVFFFSFLPFFFFFSHEQEESIFKLVNSTTIIKSVIQAILKYQHIKIQKRDWGKKRRVGCLFLQNANNSNESHISNRMRKVDTMSFEFCSREKCFCLTLTSDTNRTEWNLKSTSIFQ